VEALPPRVRLLHIGPPKTGTTALQAAGSASRAALLEHGVRYPGKGFNHRAAIAAFLGRGLWFQASTDGTPPPKPERKPWDDLLAEIEADERNRIWFGHEYAAGATAEQIAQLADLLGERLHVVLTLRGVTRILPSVWQQANKEGGRGTYDTWLQNRPFDGEHLGMPHRLRHEQGELVQRWADVVGPERMTAVIPDPADHTFIYRAFEDLLDLPPGLLVNAPAPPDYSNRSLTLPEIELIRQYNIQFRELGISMPDYNLLMGKGAIQRLTGHRRPPEGEPRLTMPDWAADKADAVARRNADLVAASGIRLVGDPELLAVPAVRRKAEDPVHEAFTQVPVDLATTALLGATLAGSKVNAELAAAKQLAKERAEQLAAAKAKAGKLAAEIERLKSEPYRMSQLPKYRGLDLLKELARRVRNRIIPKRKAREPK
jgi:hypothetical protein